MSFPSEIDAESHQTNVPRIGLGHVVAIFLALIILFEEWGWEPLSRMVGKLSAMPAWARLEKHLSLLPPHMALVVLLLPWAILLPVKVLTLWLLATGRFALAMAAIGGGKIVGTAVVARLFAITKPSLMRLAWFAKCYSSWRSFKSRLISQARSTRAWSRLRLLRRRLRSPR